MAKQGSSPFDGPGSEMRPDHADFWRLAEISLQLDGQSEAGRGIDKMVGEVIDLDSLSYVAMQRAMKVLGVKTRVQMQSRLPSLAGLAAMYLEAFIAGFRYNERHPSESQP